LVGPVELFNKLLQDPIMLAEQKRDEILDRQLTSRPNPYHDEIVEFELNQSPFQNSDFTKVLKTSYEPFIYKLTQTVIDQKQDEILDYQLTGLPNSYLTEIDSFNMITDRYDISAGKLFSIPFEFNRENFHTTDDASDQQDSFAEIPLNEKKIPQWIKSKINRWSNYYEKDSEFFLCVNYMVMHEIISFNDWNKSKSLQEKQVTPDWFLDIGDLWSDGKISDEEFISAIEYLLEERVIRISHS